MNVIFNVCHYGHIGLHCLLVIYKCGLLLYIHYVVFAGDSEVQRTMLELLNQLDGFEPKQNIKVSIQ